MYLCLCESKVAGEPSTRFVLARMRHKVTFRAGAYNLQPQSAKQKITTPSKSLIVKLGTRKLAICI